MICKLQLVIILKIKDLDKYKKDKMAQIGTMRPAGVKLTKQDTHVERAD